MISDADLAQLARMAMRDAEHLRAAGITHHEALLAARSAAILSATQDPGPCVFMAVRSVEGVPEEAIDALARETLERWSSLVHSLGLVDDRPGTDWRPPIATLLTGPWPSVLELARAWQNTRRPADWQPLDREGMLWLDAGAADFIEKLGPDGKIGAAALRAKAKDRWQEHVQPLFTDPHAAAALWRLWVDPSYGTGGPRILANLASVLWKDVVQPRLEKERQKQPALAYPISKQIADLWRPDLQLALFDGHGGATLTNGDGEVVAQIPTLEPHEFQIMQRSHARLGSVHGHRVIRDVARRGQLQVLKGQPNASILLLPGADEYAEEIGIRGGKGGEAVLDVLRAGQMFHKRWEGGETGGLWTYRHEKRTGPGRRASLEVRPGPILLPYYGKQHGLQNQFLVPIVALPPFVGRRNDHGPQAAFQFHFVAALVERRRELVQYGGAKVTRDELERMAAAAGLPTSLLDQVIDRWTQDGDDAERCLERVERDRYHLPDNSTYRDARAFLNVAGGRSAARSRNAQIGVAKRTAKLDGRTRRGGKG